MPFPLFFNVMRSQAVPTPYRKWVAYVRITNDVIDIDCTTCFRVPLQASNQPLSREKVSWLLVHHSFGSNGAGKTFYRKSMLKLKQNFGVFSYPSIGRVGSPRPRLVCRIRLSESYLPRSVTQGEADIGNTEYLRAKAA